MKLESKIGDQLVGDAKDAERQAVSFVILERELHEQIWILKI